MAAIVAFNDRLRAEGHWDFAGGLASPRTATVIDNQGSEALFSDGPPYYLARTDLDSCDSRAGNGSKKYRNNGDLP
jgi:hypothetical protein